MTLDVRPIWFLAALCSAGFGVLILLLRRNYSDSLRRALTFWGLAYFCFGGVFFLRLEADRFSSYLVNAIGPTLSAIGFVFEYWAISVLKNQKTARHWLAGPPLVLFALLTSIYSAQLSKTLTMAVANFVLAAIALRSAVSFAQPEDRRRRMVDLAAAGSFVVLALSTVVATIAYFRLAHLSSSIDFDNAWIIYSAFFAVVVEAALFGLFLLAVAERLNDHLNFQVSHDQLTGVYNRRAFEDIALHENSAAARAGAPLSLFLVDIDHFKRFNEQYGHAVGDFILRAAARTLEGCLREEDYVCRWGGDEFCALLRRTTRDEAERVAERTLAAFRGIDLAVQGKQIKVDISIGIVTRDSNSADFPSLVRLADTAVIRAKESGRSCFVMS